MSTARALQNDPRQATCVNVSDQIIVTRFHEGGLRARLSLVGLCSLSGPVELNWHLPLNTRIGRSTTGALCFTLSTRDRRERV